MQAPEVWRFTQTERERDLQDSTFLISDPKGWVTLAASCRAPRCFALSFKLYHTVGLAGAHFARSAARDLVDLVATCLAWKLWEPWASLPWPGQPAVSLVLRARSTRNHGGEGRIRRSSCVMWLLALFMLCMFMLCLFMFTSRWSLVYTLMLFRTAGSAGSWLCSHTLRVAWLSQLFKTLKRWFYFSSCIESGGYIYSRYGCHDGKKEKNDYTNYIYIYPCISILGDGHQSIKRCLFVDAVIKDSHYGMDDQTVTGCNRYTIDHNTFAVMVRPFDHRQLYRELEEGMESAQPRRRKPEVRSNWLHSWIRLEKTW